MSPIQGKVALLDIQSNETFIKAGEKLMTIIPKRQELLGKMEVGTVGSGKIKKGQSVNIRLANFEEKEYDILKAKVKEISLVPKDKQEQNKSKSYIVSIALEQNLKTNYGKKIPFKAELEGQASIVTESRSLLLRLFEDVRKLFND